SHHGHQSCLWTDLRAGAAAGVDALIYGRFSHPRSHFSASGSGPAHHEAAAPQRPRRDALNVETRRHKIATFKSERRSAAAPSASARYSRRESEAAKGRTLSIFAHSQGAVRSRKKPMGFVPPQQPLAKTSPGSLTSMECGPGASTWPSTFPVARSSLRIHGD